MPLVRYFLCVGGVLLALLFISDAYLPKVPMPETAANAPTDRSMIRISSDRKWPERVVFDTSSPTVAAVQTAKADVPAAAQAAVAEIPAKVRVSAAFAQMPASEPKTVEASDPLKPHAKPQQKRRVARKRASPPMVLVARQPQFSFFANNTW
jgi:hypothetical protein